MSRAVGAAFSAADTLELARLAHNEGDTQQSRAYVLAYALTARSQSEILPLRWGPPPPSEEVGWHSAVEVQEAAVTVIWERRKNADTIFSFRPSCTCGGAPFLERQAPCAPCAFRDLDNVCHIAAGSPIFTFPKEEAVANLRKRATLARLRAQSAKGRGRARDEYQAGTPLSRILELGGWRSSAVLRYLSIKEIDQQTVFASTVAESDSE
jgi:hypothetical protein